MNSQVQQIYDLACMLSEDERRELIAALTKSLAGDAPASESAKIPWNEVEKRIEE